VNEEPAGCCAVVHGCVFAKALLARAVSCECAARRQSGEATVVDCRSPVAHHNCETLAALFAERARFALRLPPAGRPLLHVQALRLQCGGVAALREHLHGAAGGGAGEGEGEGDGSGGASVNAACDVHRLVLAAQERHRSLTDLPWAELVPRIQAWTPRRRATPRP
jgi:hypothetical protein